MAQYIPGDDSWANAFRQGAAGAVQGYTDRSDELALQKSIEKLQPNASPQDVLKTIIGTKTYGSAAKQQAFENYSKSQLLQNQINSTQYKKSEEAAKKVEEEKKKKKEIGEASALIQNSELPDEKKQEILGQINQGDIGFKGAKELAKPPKKERDIFEEEATRAAAKRFNEAKEDLPKLRDTLSNIKRLRSMLENVKGASGFVKAALNTESAKEFDTLAAVSTQPILKIFNPSGPVAVAKANLVLSRFAPSSGELSSTSTGKINTLELFAQQAYDRAAKEIQLGEKHKGKIPEEEMAKLNADTDVMLDVFSSADPATNNVTGYYSTKDGRALKPMSIQQALDLSRQGLITNVKPK